MPMVFGSTLTLPTFILFFFSLLFFRLRCLRLGVRVRLRLWLRLGVYLLRSLPFYQTYCTLAMRYCYVTSGV